MEKWKPIKGYEGIYEVSNKGRIKGRTQFREWFTPLSLTLMNNGYLRARLYKNGRSKAYSVHRLVAEAFIPNPDNLPIVNHKDEDRTNNCAENLEWCTSKYNSQYSRDRRKRSTNISDTEKPEKVRIGF